MSKKKLKTLLKKTSTIAILSGDFILKYWTRQKVVSQKDKRDVVSNVDILAERLIKKELK